MVVPEFPLILPLIVLLNVLIPAIVSSPVVCTLLDKAVVTVVEKLASSPRAPANSFNVFNKAGAPVVIAEIAAALFEQSVLFTLI